MIKYKEMEFSLVDELIEYRSKVEGLIMFSLSKVDVRPEPAPALSPELQEYFDQLVKAKPGYHGGSAHDQSIPCHIPMLPHRPTILTNVHCSKMDDAQP